MPILEYCDACTACGWSGEASDDHTCEECSATTTRWEFLRMRWVAAQMVGWLLTFTAARYFVDGVRDGLNLRCLLIGIAAAAIGVVVLRRGRVHPRLEEEFATAGHRIVVAAVMVIVLLVTILR